MMLNRQGEKLVKMIKGPDAIVGPALVYDRMNIGVMVVHGESGTPGELTEIVLGEFVDVLPIWAEHFHSVRMMLRGGQVTMADARKARASIVDRLRANLRSVQAYDSELALTAAYARQFPSETSRRLFDEVVAEKAAK